MGEPKVRKIKRMVRSKDVGIASNIGDIENNLEEPELETVYEAVPKPTINSEALLGFWSDEIPDIHELFLRDVIKLLSAEAERLLAAGFVLYGIDFNPQKLSESEALAAIRTQSIHALTMLGKTFTQSKIDDVRKGEEKRAIAERAAIGLARSEQSQYLLPYNFASGVMTEQQSKEFRDSGVLTKKFLKSSPPSPERLFKIVGAERLSESLSRKIKNNFTVEGVRAYDEFWKGICSEICNNEFGRRSYWIASGGDWAIGEYSAEVLRTAFACGFSVTPVVSLEQLRAIFERSHNYLNDLELAKYVVYTHCRQFKDYVRYSCN